MTIIQTFDCVFLCRSARIRTENLRQSSDYHVISMGFYHLNYGTLNISPAGNTYRIELGQYLTRLLDVVGVRFELT